MITPRVQEFLALAVFPTLVSGSRTRGRDSCPGPLNDSVAPCRAVCDEGLVPAEEILSQNLPRPKVMLEDLEFHGT